MVNFDSHNNPELPEPDQLDEPHLNGNRNDDVNGGGVGEGYEGYELLGQEMEIPASDDDSESDSEDEFRMDDEPINEDTPVVDHGPQVESEIEAEVWNAPRPEELNIPLDSTKTEQILSVMANIKLPTNAIPDWGVSIPEEQWKQNLLQKIRARQSGPDNQ